eukprot:5811991-Prymnesium_polylepis.1
MRCGACPKAPHHGGPKGLPTMGALKGSPPWGPFVHPRPEAGAPLRVDPEKPAEECSQIRI